MQKRPRRTPQRRRRGMAVAELAVCLPVIVLVLFGAIQAYNLHSLKYDTVSHA